MRILEQISAHADLVGLNDAQQKQLCAQIREFLVSNVANTGGHLASNLGVVELTVAIETVFDTNKDRLVFDVGHQSYVHKLLTGRQADFQRLRQFGGMAGFPKPSESDTDAFVAGHASSSVSIALGMARARSLQKDDYHVIAVMGDGAATGGMAYEGLNDAAVSKEPLIVILNDNEMSIDRNVGGMAKHLAKLRTKERYLGMKERYRSIMVRIPGGRAVYHATRRVKDWLKRALLPTTIFENIGFDYLGPVDGHDLHELIRVLKVAKELHKPVLLHVLTRKGNGYSYAEAEPSKFHGVGKFDPATGEVLSKGGCVFSDAFGDALQDIARRDDRICAITAAMPGGTGLLGFKNQFPKRLFDVGIAEEHAVSMAGGLSKQGMVPVVALYSTFLQRAYDQIMQDVAMLHLHVVFAVDRAGLVGEDGETHHGIYDVGFLRQAPGMMVLCPVSCLELDHMLHWAVEQYDGPVAIRYPRGSDRGFSASGWKDRENISLAGDLMCHREGRDITLITYGTVLENVMQAADILAKKGIEATVLRLLTVAPLPTQKVLENLSESSNVLIVEEAAGSGVHEALALHIIAKRPNAKVSAIDLSGEFITHGSLASLYQHCGLDSHSIANKALEVCRDEN